MKIYLKSFPYYILFFFIFISLMFYCKNRDKNVIEEKKFIIVYSQLYIINEMNIEKRYRIALMDDLLKQFDMTYSDIRNTIDYYNESPEKWLKVIEKMSKQVEELKQKGRK
jgi:hypothetical protein